MIKPNVLFTTLPSGAYLLRFDSIGDLFYYDDREVNPHGLGMRHLTEYYLKNRFTLGPTQRRLIERAKSELVKDKDFLRLVYKGKSSKRTPLKDKFIGNLSIPEYAAGSDKIFQRMAPGAKKQTLNLAFQVGILQSGNYEASFVKILKTILICQAMNINVNIDMFDSDTEAIGGRSSYIIVNVIKSCEKIDFRKLLICSHEQFFYTSLFNGYSASGKQKKIGHFLPRHAIIEDLACKYDIIGGNMRGDIENPDMISEVLKIGLGHD